jgi:preprotein translocase SecE subunit
VARQTRAQRRARRAEAAGRGDGASPQRAVPTQPAVRPAPPRAEAGERRVPGRGAKQFVSESLAELKKVEWPRQNQLIQGVVVVLVACIIVGLYLYANDLVWKRVVHHLFLR